MLFLACAKLDLISFCLRFLILWTSRFINQISIRDTFFTNFYRGIMKQKLVLTKPPCNCPIYKIITLFGMNLELLVGLFLSNFWHYYNSPWWIWKELWLFWNNVCFELFLVGLELKHKILTVTRIPNIGDVTEMAWILSCMAFCIDLCSNVWNIWLSFSLVAILSSWYCSSYWMLFFFVVNLVIVIKTIFFIS